MAKKVKVHCAYCGKELIRDEAYLVKKGKKNIYYCNQEHSLLKTPRALFYEEVEKIIKTTSSVFYKEMDSIAAVHGFDKMTSYVKNNEQYLNKIMQKNFNSEFGKIRYFSTVIGNELGDYVIPKPVIKKTKNIEVYETKYKKKEDRAGLESLFDELFD